MESSLFPWLFFLFAIFALMVGVLSARAAARRTQKTMRELAGRLGLPIVQSEPVLGFVAQSPSVEGLRRGKYVRLYTYSTGSGKSRTTWAAVSARTRGRRLSFSLESQGVGSKIKEMFGIKEITVGDRLFDEAWFIRAEPAEFFRIALIPELRERLMAGRRAGLTGVFRCEQGEVRYAEVGGFADQGKVERYLLAADLCCDLADVADVAGV